MAIKRKSSSRKSRSKKGATLLQLQKLAKAHNIKVTGLKKSSVQAKLRSHGIAIPRRKSIKSSSKKSKKKCKSGQTLNKSTGRCRKSPSKKSRSGKKKKSSSSKKSKKKCKSGQTLNKSTGRCRKSLSKKSRSAKKCKSGQTLNRSTKRCRAKCKPGQKRNSAGVCRKK